MLKTQNDQRKIFSPGAIDGTDGIGETSHAISQIDREPVGRNNDDANVDLA